jgi:hypothetical protein
MDNADDLQLFRNTSSAVRELRDHAGFRLLLAAPGEKLALFIIS